jgi:hypothetical protein
MVCRRTRGHTWEMRVSLPADSSVEVAAPFPLSKQLVKFDRIRPFFAGVIAGIFGGGAMVAVVDTLMARHSELAHPFVQMLASRFETKFAAPWPAVIGIAIFVALASLLSGAFATLTQRLRKIVPLLLWTALFFGALWIMGDAILIAKFPGIGAKLPFLPLLAGAEIFAVLSCLQLPLRSDRGVIEVEQRRDSFA